MTAKRTKMATKNFNLAKLARNINIEDDGSIAFSNEVSAGTGGETIGSLTASMDSDQTTTINLTTTSTPVPIVQAYKEVPQVGISAKGQWNVNANATNYDFYDEKPISYASSTLTPSATGDGTFTSSSPIVSDQWNLTTASYASKQKDLSALMSNGANDGTDIKFKPDGTKLYLLTSGTYDYVNQFSLSTAWDITTATLDGVTADLSSGTSITNPYSFCFTDDGTRIYVADFPGTIKEYTLSTAWDLSTVSFSDDLSVSGNETQVSAINISSDGTKIYFSGQVSDKIWQVTMSTAKDLTTAGSPTQAINISSQEGDVESIQLKDDGTKLYMVGYGSDTIHQYSLSTAWDATTGSYDSVSYNLPAAYGGSNDRPRGFVFKPNGTNFYILGQTNDIVFQYSVGSLGAFNASDIGKRIVGNSGSAIITSAAGAYTSVTAFADTSAISSWQLFGAEGKADGSGISLSGYSTQNDIVFPTGASGSGATMIYSNNVSPTSSIFDSLRSISLNNQGTIALVLTSGKVQRFNLSIAFDLSTMTEDATNSVTNQMTTNMFALAVKPDGTRFWVSDYNQDLIKQYTMSTAWSPSTASYDGYYMLNNGGAWNNFSGGGSIPSTTNFNPFGIQFNSDGTKMISIMWDNAPYHSVVEFTLSTGWDMSTMSYTSYANLVGNSDPEAIAISADGLKLMMHGSGLGDGGIEVYSLPSAFSVGTAGSNLTRTSGAMDLSTLTGNSGNNITYGGLSMSSDGKRLWVIYNNNSGANPVYEITGGSSGVHPYSTYYPALTNSSTGQINSSSWLDINSMTADETKNGGDIFYAVSTDNRTSWGVANASDGVRKIAKNNSGTWQYNNSAGTNNPWQYNSGAASGNTLTISSAFNNGSWISGGGLHNSANVKFSPDGTKIFWAPSGGNSDGDDIYTANLSTAWDLSTATQGPVYTEYSSSGYGQGSFAFNSDGTKLYTVIRISTASASRTVRQWSLSTAYDVSTSSYVGISASIGNYGHRGLYVAPDESYFITVDLASGQTYIKKWNLATAGDITSTLTGETAVDVTTYTNWSNPAVGSFYATAPDFFDSGNKMVIVNHGNGGSNTNDAYLVELSTAYDITSGTVIGKFTTSTGADLKGVGIKPDGTKLYAPDGTGGIVEYNTGSVQFTTAETWVNGTNNNEHATLQEALGAQAFNRMNKAQLDAVADAYHFSQDSADTLDLMIAPYAASGTSPISDGVTINYDTASKYRQAVPETDYRADFVGNNKLEFTSNISANFKVKVL